MFRLHGQADFIRRAARSSGNVGQPDHILTHPVTADKAERRPGGGEIRLAVADHDGVQVDAILIDQAKLGEASGQVRASDFDLSGAPGFQLTDRTLEIIADKRGVGADRLQRARNDPFRLLPPRGREGVLLCTPFGMIVVPIAHDFVHLATVYTARLRLRLLDEVAEERGARRKRHMVDVTVQGLVHSEHELGHTLLGVGAELATDDNDRLIRAIRDGAQDTVNQAGQQIIQRQLQVAPTLTIRPGFPVRVIVTRDIVFEPYRS